MRGWASETGDALQGRGMGLVTTGRRGLLPSPPPSLELPGAGGSLLREVCGPAFLRLGSLGGGSGGGGVLGAGRMGGGQVLC